MKVRIADLMTNVVITSTPHKTLGHVKEVMRKNKISAVAIVDYENEPKGIVTTNDFKLGVKDNTPVSSVLSGKIYTVPAYNKASVAARIMLKRKVHHVLVTHEKKLVGMISSFDLLSLLDSKKYTLKQK
jgi:CBS domain-containing protein